MDFLKMDLIQIWDIEHELNIFAFKLYRFNLNECYSPLFVMTPCISWKKKAFSYYVIILQYYWFMGNWNVQGYTFGKQ